MESACSAACSTATAQRLNGTESRELLAEGAVCTCHVQAGPLAHPSSSLHWFRLGAGAWAGSRRPGHVNNRGYGRCSRRAGGGAYRLRRADRIQVDGRGQASRRHQTVPAGVPVTGNLAAPLATGHRGQIRKREVLLRQPGLGTQLLPEALPVCERKLRNSSNLLEAAIATRQQEAFGATGAEGRIRL